MVGGGLVVGSAFSQSGTGSRADGASVTYEVDNGFARESTQYVIQPDGAFHRTHAKRLGDATREESSGHLSKGEAADLRRKVNDANLPGLKSRYDCTMFASCGADAPLVTITTETAGHVTEVEVDRNVPEQELPRALVTLLQCLDQLTAKRGELASK